MSYILVRFNCRKSILKGPYPHHPGAEWIQEYLPANEWMTSLHNHNHNIHRSPNCELHLGQSHRFAEGENFEEIIFFPRSLELLGVDTAFQHDIKRSEVVRQNLALELHDSILNKLAALMMKLDDKSMTPEFQQSYSELTMQLREMVKNLRPVMLNYGLQPALEGYVDSLTDYTDGRVRVILDLKSDNPRYSPDVEQHVFRIVQEAYQNAFHHGNPNQITISGHLEPDLIELNVQDKVLDLTPKNWI